MNIINIIYSVGNLVKGRVSPHLRLGEDDRLLERVSSLSSR
jgi:hypothetical protein